MENFLNVRVLLYLWMSLLLNRASSETFTNARTSYLQLKRWNVSEIKGLGFRFKTFLPDALLLYMDDQGQTNFLRVELFQGKLRLTCSYGSRYGAMAVEIGDNLNDLNWHYVLLERNNGKTTISLDNRSKSTINSREKTSLIIKSPMFFGGLPPNLSPNRVTQPSVILLSRQSRFLGCVTDIELFEYSSGRGNRRKAIEENSDGIAAGCVDKCEKENKCQNNGTCLNRFTTTACDCTATGYRGEACEQGILKDEVILHNMIVLNHNSPAYLALFVLFYAVPYLHDTYISDLSKRSPGCQGMLTFRISCLRFISEESSFI